MHIRIVPGCLIAAALSFPAAVLAQPQLTTVLSGLSSPVFVGHANDGTGRLFVVEQGGLVRVRQPGSTGTTVFLDIRTKVLAGGERGLLGLAFHPQYAGTGRFFVFYTRAGDGALVIAEYGVSANRDVADPNERVLLTIPHPTNANHNGGMIAFGPDGFLYIGVGDGGSGNDPPNNAQNVNTLLGKILRIDVNVPAGSTAPYLVPLSNPFYGSIAGLDEIFAFGLRNPWRFSFDRVTGQQWVGDVGQNAREEVDAPIVNGGNYGWRVYEGSQCTGLDPSLCNPANYLFPVVEYDHSGGRCSITGGYAYRGSAGTFPPGTYLYADFCTGEIFAWNGSSSSVLLDTTMNISSFGEDEAGELYVVGLGGVVARLSRLSCSYAISPTRATFGAAGSTGTVSVSAGAGCAWTAVSNDSWIVITGGATGEGNGTVTYTVAPYSGRPRNRNGSIAIAGHTHTVRQSR